MCSTGSIEQMLWPERREQRRPLHAPEHHRARRRLHSAHDGDSYIRVPRGFVPDGSHRCSALGQRLFPMFFRNGEVEIGPIPKGTPVSLFTSMDLTGADLPRGPAPKSSGRSCSGSR